MPRASTIAEILIERGTGSQQKRRAITYLREGRTILELTGSDVLERARRVAGALNARDIRPGDRVMLMLPSPPDFVDAFCGAIWAGAIPVPVCPPMFIARPDDFLGHVLGIAKSSQPRLLMTSAEIAPLAGDVARTDLPDVAVLSPDGFTASEPLAAPRCGGPADLAFLQYTSGSTGHPKGVALSHRNILSNLIATGSAIGIGPDDVGVSWLPFHHDMGLIGTLLSALYWGAPLVSLSALEFAKRPGSWLRAISDHRGTLSPAPNFAFRRCLAIPDDEVRGLDLSSWRVAFNGAEPVDAETVRRFSARFATIGFRSRALYPVYGLAEHTLAISFPPPGAEPRVDRVDRATLAETSLAVSVPADHAAAVSIVCVGRPLDGVSLQIRACGAQLPAGHVGEIVVKSPSVMMGYFQNAAATSEVLSDGWLATGDLGYMKDGFLYVTGRQKDLIIRAGRKYYPQDIESAAGEVAGVRAGRIACFSIDGDPEEQVVVLLETSVLDAEAREELKDKVAAAVAARMGFRPKRVVLCEPSTLPVTSSGKVRRAVARARFISSTRAARN